jgi:hypothetical protein
MDQLEVSPCPTLEEVRRQFEVWRNANKPRSPIPSRLWDSAASLATRHSVHEISRALRLNYAKLKNHIGAATTTPTAEAAPQPFVELPFPYTRESECLVDMENRHGDRMRIRLSGERTLDLLSLGKAFWSQEP